jgi:predicted O-methyltransferase YrrM
MDTRELELCNRYVADLFAAEDSILEELRQASTEEGLPQISVSRSEGKLLQVLLRAVNASRVLELGTLGGYSALWMARALPEAGRLITVERDPRRARLAREFIERAGLADRVTVRVGTAAELLPGLAEEGPFDAVFIDADKEGYPEYLARMYVRVVWWLGITPSRTARCWTAKRGTRAFSGLGSSIADWRVIQASRRSSCRCVMA